MYTFCSVAIFSICHFGTPFACSEANLTNDNNEQLIELIRSLSLNWERLGTTGNISERHGMPGNARKHLKAPGSAWESEEAPKAPESAEKCLVKSGGVLERLKTL